MNELEKTVECRFCGCILPYKDEFCKECHKELAYIIPESINDLSFLECVDLIDDAFFKLESFMKGKINYYNYFGFNDHFSKLFFEGKKADNFTAKNCDLISPYWYLAYELYRGIDQGDFENETAFKNESFCNDWNELEIVAESRLNEFLDFNTTEYVESKTSITDIIESRQKQSQQPKPEPFNPEPTSTPFAKNNFDHVPPKRVYDYFKTELVDKNYLSLDDLHKYLIIVFQDKIVPVEKFTFAKKTKVKDARDIFYRYYSVIAKAGNNNKMNYAELLGNYFTGFTAKKVFDNFAK